MSLETEIKKLTTAIETLNTTMQARSISVPPVVEGTPQLEEPKEETPQLEEPKEETLTHDQLRDLFMGKSRENPKLKALIKKLLGSYGATKVTDIKESDLKFIMEKARAL